MRTREGSIWLGALVVAVAGLVLLASEDSAPRARPSISSCRPPVVRWDSFLESERSVRTNAARAAAPEQRLARIFRVADGRLGTSLVFTAGARTAGVEIAILSRGSLLVSASESLWNGGLELDVRAPGYLATSAMLSATSRDEIELTPVSKSRIRVVRDGTPVRIERAILGHMHEGATSVLSEADVTRQPDGSVEFVHSQEICVHLYEPSGALAFGSLVAPESDLLVDLSAPQVRVRLLDAADIPVTSVPTTIVGNSTSSPSSQRFVTDAQGQIAVGWDPGQPLALQLESNRVRFADADRQRPGVSVRRRIVELSSSLLESAAIGIHVRVDPAVARLRLVDQATHAPLEGMAYFVQRIRVPGQGSVDAVQHQDELDHGWMEFPTGFSQMSAAPSDGETLVAVAGYEASIVPPNAYPFLPQGLGDTELELRRVSRPCWLRVLDVGVPIDAGPLVLHSETGAALLFVGRPDAHLAYGPFDSSDAQLSLTSMSMRLATTARATDADAREYVVDIASLLGAIQIECPSGDLPPLVCVDASRTRIDATYNDGSECRFDRLPSGSYFVTSQSRVAAGPISGTEFERTAVVVRPGATTLVPCDPDWRGHAPLQGRLILSSGVPPPALLPLFGLPAGPIIDDAAIVTASVSADGAFEFRGSGQAPSALAAFDRWAGRLRVRGVITPSGTSVLDEKIVRLSNSAPRGPGDRFDVRYDYGTDWTSVAVDESMRHVDFEVELHDRPTIVPLHRSVTRIELRRRSDGRTETFESSSDPLQDVDVATLFSAR